VLCFVRDQWRCCRCGWEPARVEEYRRFGLGLPEPELVLADLRKAFAAGERHLHADHVVPIQRSRDLRLTLENLQTLCDWCHRKKTFGEARATA
jgi:hypothetical protein